MAISVTPVHDPLTGSKVDIEGTYDGTRTPPPISFHVFIKSATGLVGLVHGDTNTESQPRGFRVRIDRSNASLPNDEKDLSDLGNYVVYWDFATDPKWEPGPLPNAPPPPPRVPRAPWWLGGPGSPWWGHLIVPGVFLVVLGVVAIYVILLPAWLLIILAGLSLRGFRALRRLFARLFS